MRSKISLDDLDHTILALFQGEGRISLSELGRRIGLSVTTSVVLRSESPKPIGRALIDASQRDD